MFPLTNAQSIVLEMMLLFSCSIINSLWIISYLFVVSSDLDVEVARHALNKLELSITLYQLVGVLISQAIFVFNSQTKEHGSRNLVKCWLIYRLNGHPQLKIITVKNVNNTIKLQFN